MEAAAVASPAGIPTALILPAPPAIVAPSSEFPFALVVAPPALTSRKSVRPLPFYRLALRAPRCSKAYLRWRSAPLSTMYPLMTSASSAGDTHSESSARPSRKRYRSLAATLTSSILPPCKRFRDFISPEDSDEEDIDTDVLEDIEVMAALVISITLDVSVESVGSSFSRVILIGSIFVEVPVAPEMEVAAVASPVGIPTALILPAPPAIVAPSSEFPFALVVAPPVARAPRCSKAYLRWRSAPLSTMYPSMTSASSAGDTHSESSAGPSRKRYRSLAATLTSSILPPQDDVEDEVESSNRGDMEVGVDMDAGIDIPDGGVSLGS
nr:hypothetical protein [Tanacetum cinerariifolium]